jgi:flagellar basal-body rod protein FlgF
MASFVDVAARVLAQSERRTEIAAQNVANISTAGYKRRIPFTQFIDPLSSGVAPDASTALFTDFSIGKQIDTGNPFDLALTSSGFFVVQGADGPLYTRQGQFKREADGRLVTLQGLAVQAQGGGDVILKTQDFKVAGDGTVTENGEPVARLAVVDFSDRSAATRTETGQFAAPAAAVKDVDAPAVRQGAIEASNVSTGDDMVAVMEAVRRAETAQRLVNVYDDLMGRALSTFGQS